LFNKDFVCAEFVAKFCYKEFGKGQLHT